MTHFQDPLDCYCFCRKTEASGNVRRYWKCWWYDQNGKRKSKSFAVTKYGFLGARIKIMEHLEKVNAKSINQTLVGQAA